MDKTEYKIKADEINELIQQGEYARAAEIADTIDWRRVRSVMMLCKVSDLYKMNRRYEEARDMLLLAYEHRQGGRTICYSLCELFIKMEDHVHALEFYKEYMQVSSPNDVGRYILKYKLYEAEEVNLEERIEVLEKLKECEPREKWMYELAYLYHRVGLATRCVEECDELILYFGGKVYANSKYVIKAMELKMLHQKLTPEQQFQYDHRFDPYEAVVQNQEELPAQEEDYGIDEEPVAQEAEDEEPFREQPPAETQTYEPVQVQTEDPAHTRVYEPVRQRELESPALRTYEPEPKPEPEPVSPKEPEELDIQVKTVDVGQYNTINLQAELAAGLKEVLEEGQPLIEDPITRSIVAPMLETDASAREEEPLPQKEKAEAPQSEEIEGSEVFFGETGELADLSQEPLKQTREGASVDVTASLVMEQLRREITASAPLPGTDPPKELAGVLSQEPDGQISLVVPESAHIEKQITGQMNIDDILVEWERMKKENQEKRQEEVRQHVLQHTGDMFTEFEAAVRDGLLEKLESEGMEDFPGEEQPQELFAEETWVEDENSLPDAGKAMPEVQGSDSQEADAQGMDSQEEEAFWEDGDFEEETEPEVELVPEIMSRKPEAVPVPEVAGAASSGTVLEGKPEAAPGPDIEEAASPAIVPEAAPEPEAEEEMVLGVPSEAAPEPEAEEAASPGAEPEPEPEVEEKAAPVTVPEEKPKREAVPQPEEPPAVKKAAAKPAVEREKGQPRSLTREEKDLYAPFIQERSAREQLAAALDNISLAAYTGNIVITGEEGMDTIGLAKNMIREVQGSDSNFSGKVAKISGKALNDKDVAATIGGLKNGALIIQKVSQVSEKTAAVLHKCLQQENMGIIIVIEDTRENMDAFLEKNHELSENFTSRMDVEAMNNDSLVAYGKQYAKNQEYAIDELGMLALHTRIEELQTLDHAVTGAEVREIVDGAIRHANKKTLGHFFDVLFAKRYDNEDMIILGEKDFV